MNIDFRLSTGIFEHPKVLKLERKLGEGAVLSYIRLLRFTAQNKPDGNLTGMDIDDIEIAAGYKGTPGSLVPVLFELNLLDHTGDTITVHDWAQHNPYACGAPRRSEIARLGGEARQEKARITKEQEDSSAKNSYQQKTAQLPAENSSAPSPSFRLLPYPSVSDSISNQPTTSEDEREGVASTMSIAGYNPQHREPTTLELQDAFILAGCNPRHVPDFAAQYATTGWVKGMAHAPITNYFKLIAPFCNTQEQREADNRKRGVNSTNGPPAETFNVVQRPANFTMMGDTQ